MSEMFSLGLIGFPLGHSVSPTLHHTALAEAKLSGSYSLFPIPPLPEGQVELEALLNRLRKEELQGLNVTIPHKQSVLPLVDDLTPSARAIGAVNTLYLETGKLIGHNTDAPGFWADLKKLPLDGVKVALILGAGGAARAIVYALLSRGWQISITDLNPQQTTSLVDHFSAQLTSISLTALDFNPDSIRQAAESAHLIINATPVGMHPNVDASPWPESVSLPKHACLYDVVYNPMETQLMKQAKAAALPCRKGLGMLVEHAALSFECWTGFYPNREGMMKAVQPEKPARSGS